MEHGGKDQVAEPEPGPGWRVAGGSPIRLDAFLGQCLPHLSARRVRALLQKGGCTVNGRSARKGTILFPGDRVLFCGDRRYLAHAPISRGEHLPILFEDDCLVAVEKPYGLATHGHSGKDDATLANSLLSMRPELAGIGKSPWEPGIVHRLDRDTSGIVLAAKQQGVFEHLRQEFRKRNVGKFYRAIVQGSTPAEGRVDYPLAHDTADRRKMRHVSAEGFRPRRIWPALTRFRTVGRGSAFSHVEVQIETGVTHQIRVHMNAIGYPIVGDPLYGSDWEGAERCLLHASRLVFWHPLRGKRTVIESPLPAAFHDFLEP